MKVVHLSTSDAGGGAAEAAYRIHTGLRQRGVDSSLLVGEKSTDDSTVSSVVSKEALRWRRWLDRLPRRLLRTANQSLISPAWVGTSAWKEANHRSPSIHHLHWTCNGFLRLESIARLKGPILWSLHDMWAFSGGEHYVGASRRYSEGYEPQNRPPDERGFDLNRWVWQRKMRAWSAIPNLHLYAVSEWLAKCAQKSVLFCDRPVGVLYNALDAEVFKPVGQTVARNLLGLPVDQPLVLFGAVDATSDHRKGFDLLASALEKIRRAGIALQLVVFGNAPNHGPPFKDLGFITHYLGKITDKRRLAAVYSACDVMAVPSREESFGQTALEALACGTPVVAFRVGGIPEMVTHRVSGFLARPFETEELAAGIAWVISLANSPEWKKLSAAGRRVVEENFTLERQAQRCEYLYHQALENSRRLGALV